MPSPEHEGGHAAARISRCSGRWGGMVASAHAQQTMPVIGYVSGRSLEYEERLLSSFRKGLEERAMPPVGTSRSSTGFPTVTTAGYRGLPPISSAARWP